MRVLGVLVVVIVAAWSSASRASKDVQGMTVQGMTVQGMTVQGMTVQGMTVQGMTVQGMTVQGMTVQGMTVQGMTVQGMTVQGMGIQGMTVQGMTVQGMTVQGMTVQGMELRGIDRLRSYGAALVTGGVARADVQVPGAVLTGLQDGRPINYVETRNPMMNVRLQAGPGDDAPGSYIYVPGLSGTSADIKGTFWNLVLGDSTGQAGIVLHVSDVERDSTHNSSKYPANDDVYLYTVYYRQPATGQWAALCPLDTYGKATAVAVPLDPNDWTSDIARANFTFACTASGVAAKCARNWGYKPWKTVNERIWKGAGFVESQIQLAPFYGSPTGSVGEVRC